MSELAKAALHQLRPDFQALDEDPAIKLKAVVVQFNPETLKVSYQNQVEKPEGGGDKRGSPSQLFVGEGSTKLTCSLWFDVSAPQPRQPDASFNDVDDVRKLTNRVTYFITPQPDKKDPKKFVPPGVRFIWGSFQFDGVLESVEESLEYFSPEGKPLRANVAISMTQQKILTFPPTSVTGEKKPVGTRPTTPVPQGSSVQKMAGENWQGVAQANDVENPRRPPPGQRLDLSRS